MSDDLRITQAERISALEVQVHHLLEEQQKTNQKLDSLLGLRNKGVGAFWLASALAGTGIVSLLAAVMDWFKGGPLG